jgi:hypothetical protein
MGQKSFSVKSGTLFDLHSESVNHLEDSFHLRQIRVRGRKRMFAGLNFNLPNHQEAESDYSDLSNSVCGMWARLDRVGWGCKAPEVRTIQKWKGQGWFSAAAAAKAMGVAPPKAA